VGQEALFYLETTDEDLVDPSVSVSVNRQMRAVFLLDTLELVGKVRSGRGFADVTDPNRDSDSDSGQNIIDRYGPTKTSKIRKNKLAKQHKLMSDAKWQFARASGWIALRDAGLIEDEYMKQMALEDFTAFAATYFGGEEQRSKRNTFRRKLKKQQDIV